MSLDDTFNTEPPKKVSNEITVKEENKNLPVELGTLEEEQKENLLNKKEAVENLKNLSKKGNQILDVVLDALTKQNTEEYYNENPIDPKSITAIASLIKSIADTNGKILGDDKIKSEKIINNTTNQTQNNLIVDETKKGSIGTTKDFLNTIQR